MGNGSRDSYLVAIVGRHRAVPFTSRRYLIGNGGGELVVASVPSRLSAAPHAGGRHGLRATALHN